MAGVTPTAHVLAPTAAQRAGLGAALSTPSALNPFMTKSDTAHGQAVEFTFAETAGDGVYTATLAIPAGAYVEDVRVHNTVVWNAGTSASLVIGDGDDSDGYVAATDVKSAPTADTNGAGGISTRLSLGATAGAYKGGGGKYYAMAGTITVTLTKVGTGANGRTRIVIEYTVPTTSVIAKV